MFALRASCFSISRRCPSFVPRLSQTYSTTDAPSDNPTTQPPDALAFLSDPIPASDPTPGSGPTPFDVPEPAPVADGPPTAPQGSFPKKSATSPIGISSKNEIPEYKLHCHSSRNNTIVTFTKPDGNTIAWFSGGSTEKKFKKGNRASYEAGYQCAKSIFKKIDEWNTEREQIRLEVLFKGYGEGREAMKTALLATEGEHIRALISRVTDRTPIKIGGTRAKKMRRG